MKNNYEPTKPHILRFFSFEISPLISDTIYAMQLLCCYNLAAGKEPPLSELFDKENRPGFEEMRDLTLL